MHHIAWVFDGTTHRPYVDGVAVTPRSDISSGAWPAGNYVFNVNAGKGIQGMDDLRIFNKALTNAEIISYMNA